MALLVSPELPSTHTAEATAGTVDLVAIDMDTTGNDDTTIGAIDACAPIISVGGTLTIDLVIKGVDTADRIKGYQWDIDYNPSVIKITGVLDVDPSGSTSPNNITILSRIASVGGAGFLGFSDTAPDTDGTFTAAAADTTAGPAPPANHESGDGVLARIAIEAVGLGLSPLTIPGPAGGSDTIQDSTIIAGAGGFVNAPVPIDLIQSGSVAVGAANGCADDDFDGVLNIADNCPNDPNPLQEDNDGDGLGDVCDPDDDNDGDLDGADNCPLTPNPGQEDFDTDLIGDACDDSDSDGYFDDVDNCPSDANPTQFDFDDDGLGEPCDPDQDDDGVPNNTPDLCPNTPLDDPPVDANGCSQVDEDGDGICDPGITSDLCTGSDNCPITPNPGQEDEDFDGVGDACDDDADNDGFTDGAEIAAGSDPDDPLSTPEVCDGLDNDLNEGIDEGYPDIDFDGIADCVDPDLDNDGVPDNLDNCLFLFNPGQDDINMDGQGDACDDTDGDGVKDDVDNCLLVSNASQLNTDGDARGNACDSDDDNDGVIDIFDNCQLIQNSSQLNTDADALGNACDPDDDNDGYLDGADNCPVNANPGQEDFNFNGTGDACEDVDFDGTSDSLDNCLTTPNPGQENVVHPGTPAGDACEDFDSDTVVDATDNCPDTANTSQANHVHGATFPGDACDDPDGDTVMDATDNCPDLSNPGQANSDGDPRGDACDLCPTIATPWTVQPGDSDCDSFTNSEESFMGTDPADRCPDNALDDAWPADFDKNTVVNILDLQNVLPPAFGSFPPNPNYTVRRDLTANGVINILDVVRMLSPVFGTVCTNS